MNIRRLYDYQPSTGNEQGTQEPMLASSGAPIGEMFPPISKVLAPDFNFRSFTWFISMVQIIMFILELIIGASMFDGAFVIYNSMAGPSGLTMRFLGAKFLPDIRAGQVWRLWTPALLHGGILHIFMNGIFQFMLCFTYEKKWGTKRIAFLYFFSALGATLLSCVAAPKAVSVGASGALFGMLGANISYICMNWNDIIQPQKQICQACCVIAINIFIGMGWTDGNIDNFAHLGGLITGLLMGLAFVVSHSTFTHDRLAGKESRLKRTGLVIALIWFSILLSVSFFDKNL